MRSSLLALLILSAACNLYREECRVVERDVAPAEVQLLRDPGTGQCQEFYSGGGGYYEDECGYGWGGGEATSLVPPNPDWPQCESACTGLDVAACAATSGCQTVYTAGGLCPPDTDDCGPEYYGCWATLPYGGTDSCSTLDAYSCSFRDDCSRTHFADDAIASGESDPRVGSFEQCGPEGAVGGGCSNQSDCAPGSVCMIDPDDAVGVCLPQQTWGTCYGPVTCDAIGPDCPEGTVPGVIEGCYSGFCAPLSACEAPPSCDALTTEAQCVAAQACTATYVGHNCECVGDACVCESYDFASCED